MTIAQTIERIEELFDEHITHINYNDYGHYREKYGPQNYVGLYFGERCMYISRKYGEEDIADKVTIDYTVNYNDPLIYEVPVEALINIPEAKIRFGNFEEAQSFIKAHNSWPKEVYVSKDGPVYFRKVDGSRKVKDITKVNPIMAKLYNKG